MPIFAKECICSFTMVEQTAERSKMYKKEKKVCMMYDESMYQIVRIEFLIQKKQQEERKQNKKQRRQEEKRRWTRSQQISAPPERFPNEMFTCGIVGTNNVEWTRTARTLIPVLIRKTKLNF